MAANTDKAWTRDQDKRLLRRWRQLKPDRFGKKNAVLRQIGREFGRTASAVDGRIGKLERRR